MRKYLIVLFFILCPLFVLADSAGPSIIGYDAIVINKNGAKYDDGNIPYNTKIHVYDEYDDGTASACYIEYADDCYAGDERFNISIKDIAVLKKEIIPKDLEKVSNQGTSIDLVNSKILVANKSGIKLRKGPAEAYGFYDKKVPYKTILSFKYAINRSGPHDSWSYSWFYVDSDGYKGWIDGDICVLVNNPVLTFKEISISDDNGNTIKIPSETVLDTVYYNYPTSFVNYKEILGKVDTEKLYIGYKSKLGYILTTKSTEIKSNGKAITAIPKGEKIKIVYANKDDEYSDSEHHSTGPICLSDSECYYYIEYNGAKGFISSDDVISLYYEDKEKITKFDKDLEVYSVDYYYGEGLNEGVTLESYSKKYKTTEVIPANTNVTVYMSNILGEYGTYRSYSISLVKYKNIVGWVINSINNNDDIKSENNVNNDTNEINKTDRVLTIVVYSLIAAAILSLTAYITIVLINKKKKNSKKNKEKELSPRKKKDLKIKKKEK